MSEYRRLISYIYEYEGREKGKNVGFVKLEARNGQCRLNVNVKRMYVGGNAIGVYLLSKTGGQTFLGNMFVRGGGGEFRTTVDAKNVEGSGIGLEGYYGLTVHDVKNPWRSYTTVWEDAAVPAPEEGAEENVTMAAECDSTAGRVAQDILPGSAERPAVRVITSVVQEIEEELAQSAELRDTADSGQEETPEDRSEAADTYSQEGHEKVVRESEVILESPKEPVQELELIQESPKQSAREPELTLGTPEEPVCGNETVQASSSGCEPKTNAVQKSLQDQETRNEQHEQNIATATERAKATDSESPVTQAELPMQSPELENPEVLRYLQETEDTTADPEKLWQELRKTYPKIQPFDYDGRSEVLTIRPQDIGKLPRENWVYGNNSFLLHGYYNFRYLILVRLENSGGGNRYLIGIPGHYYSNEKYMAAMFGFPNFVLSKKQPPNDGRFGYWYTDIKMR